jgi:prephenate dehydratase
MNEILDTIDKALQEVEEQLLQEFERILNSLSDARFAPIDLGVKNAVSGVVVELYDLLDKSGDRKNLQLMTEPKKFC